MSDSKKESIFSSEAEEDENPSKKSKTGEENEMNYNALLLHLHSLPKKDDYILRFYFEASANVIVTQADRNFVAQALDFYSSRSKRDICPAVATVTAALAADIQGTTTNRTAENSVRVVFKTTKHIIGFCSYIQQTRAAHNEVILNVSVDGSPFFKII